MDDGTANTCKPKWDLTWQTVKQTTTTVWDTTYPAIQWDQSTDDFDFDFSDTAQDYLGTLQVTMTGTLPNGESLSTMFTVYNFDICETGMNLVDIDDNLDETYYLFNSEKKVTWSVTWEYSTCDSSLTY